VAAFPLLLAFVNGINKDHDLRRGCRVCLELWKVERREDEGLHLVIERYSGVEDVWVALYRLENDWTEAGYGVNHLGDQCCDEWLLHLQPWVPEVEEVGPDDEADVVTTFDDLSHDARLPGTRYARYPEDRACGGVYPCHDVVEGLRAAPGAAPRCIDGHVGYFCRLNCACLA